MSSGWEASLLWHNAHRYVGREDSAGGRLLPRGGIYGPVPRGVAGRRLEKLTGQKNGVSILYFKIFALIFGSHLDFGEIFWFGSSRNRLGMGLRVLWS